MEWLNKLQKSLNNLKFIHKFLNKNNYAFNIIESPTSGLLVKTLLKTNKVKNSLSLNDSNSIYKLFNINPNFKFEDFIVNKQISQNSFFGKTNFEIIVLNKKDSNNIYLTILNNNTNEMYNKDINLQGIESTDKLNEIIVQIILKEFRNFLSK